jgi:hypothetical protein
MSVFNRVALIATALLAGCSTEPVTIMYSPCTGADTCKIVGEKTIAARLIFKINDEKVAEGAVDLWTNTGDISGHWQDKKFDAHCHQGGDGWRTWEICSIVIDGKLAGEMNFSK